MYAPPRASVTALILLCMEYIRAFILMGILSHSSNKVALNWSRVEKILTNWQHGAGRYPAGKFGDAIAQMELQPAGGFHPYILHLLNYRLSQSRATLIREISPPRPEPSHPPNLSLSRTQASAKRSPRR